MSNLKTVSTQLPFPGLRVSLYETKPSENHISSYEVSIELISDDPTDIVELDFNLSKRMFFTDYFEAKTHYEYLLKKYQKISVAILNQIKEIKI
ncbi:MAG: hypothetical protein KDD58_04645 [Bdellovibrionales bacterium]|nr:hypothetical protein [Bdellovibrionales bacterium]